jgi:hypothetical protein
MKCSITAKNQKTLEMAIEKMENKLDEYNKNVTLLREFTNKFNGLDTAVTIVESLEK